MARRAEDVARESGGNPFWIGELARYLVEEEVSSDAPLQLSDVIDDRLAHLSTAQRSLVEVLAVAGDPIPVALAVTAAGVSPEEGAKAAHYLKVHHLSRRAGGEASEHLLPYHDRLRERVLGLLPSERLAYLHRALALAFESAEVAEPGRVARHWHGAGEPARAAPFALEAADRAAAALAFDRAATLLREYIALRDGEVDTRTWLNLGDALANTGHAPESAEAYLQAAELASGEAALEARQLAAHQLLISGRLEQGRAVAFGVLSSVGIRPPRGPVSTIFGILKTRIALRGFTERADLWNGGSRDARSRIKNDAVHAAAIGLAMIDIVTASHFAGLDTLLATEANDLRRSLRAILLYSGIYSAESHRNWPRVDSYLSVVRRRLPDVGEDALAGSSLLIEGIHRYLMGEWRDALPFFESSEELLRTRCQNVEWYLRTAELYRVYTLCLVGQVKAASELVPDYLKVAIGRGNLYAATNLRLGFSNLRWLACDQPETASENATSAIEGWPQSGATTQLFFYILGEAQRSAYAPMSPRSEEALDSQIAVVERSLLTRCEFLICHARHAAATALIARARREDWSPRSKLVRAARRRARILSRLRRPWVAACAASLRAGLAAAQGDLDTALDELSRCEAGFEGWGMHLYAMAARRCRGRLVGGDEGAELIAEVDAWMHDQGVVRPDRMANAFVAGFHDV